MHHRDLFVYVGVLVQMEGKQRLEKAVSEVDILFSYLQDFCDFPSNAPNTTTADVVVAAN